MFAELTMAHPYLMGFVKFAILATIGELCAIRILSGQWKTPVGLIYRTIIWGVLGMGIVLMFEIFFGGVTSAIAKGLLPVGSGFGQQFLKALFISTIMNLSFAPVFMAFHRFTDTCIDVACGEGVGFGGINTAAILARIDWQGFINFVVLKTVPFFWIPAHTVTFLLPPEYRVLVAASLSIALGAILAYAKRKKTVQSTIKAS